MMAFMETGVFEGENTNREPEKQKRHVYIGGERQIKTSAPALSFDNVCVHYRRDTQQPSAENSVIQLKPIVDKERGEPFYVDDKFDPDSKTGKRFLMKKFVDMKDYSVFQVRDHFRRIYWHNIPGKEDNYYYSSDDLASHNQVNIREILDRQPLDAWMEEFAAAESITTAEGAENAEQTKRRHAIMNYALQRYIVNALYRSEELDRMDYSGSPLSYQTRSSYMRSYAGSFANALKALLLGNKSVSQLYGSSKLLLTRSSLMKNELSKFFMYVPMQGTNGEGEAAGNTHEPDVSGFVDRLFKELYLMSGSSVPVAPENIIADYAQNPSQPKLFIDVSDMLTEKSAEEQGKIVRQQDLSARQAIVRGLIEKVNGAGALTISQEETDLAVRIAGAFEGGSIVVDKVKALLNEEIYKDKDIIAKINQYMDQNTSLADEKKITGIQNLSPVQAGAGIEYLISTLPNNGLLRGLLNNVSKLVITGGMVELSAGSGQPQEGSGQPQRSGGAQDSGAIRQSALLAFPSDSRLPDAAVNKAGFVPSVTESLRAMMSYSKDGTPLTIRDIAKKILEEQISSGGPKNVKDLLRQLKTQLQTEPENSSAYGETEADRESSRKLAKNIFDIFCRRLVDAPWMANRELRPYYVQASAIKKLVESCSLFENPHIPAFVWAQMDYYLEAAYKSEDRIRKIQTGNVEETKLPRYRLLARSFSDFIRSIQALHEIVLLGIEMGSGELQRGEEFLLPGQRDDGMCQGTFLADYGLKAFAQVYDAAIAQHNGNPGPLNVTAFYDIYFELTEKLDATKGAEGDKVKLETPSEVATHLQGLTGIEKIPDIVMIDIHPNDATKTVIRSNNVTALLERYDALIRQLGEDQAHQSGPKKKQVTVIVDITLNQVQDDEVKEIRDKANAYLADGWLNLVFVQSLTKFAQMGMDKHSGGMVVSYNNGREWGAFNTSLSESMKEDAVDPYMQRYFQLLFQNAEPEQKEYIEIIRENTAYVAGKLPDALENTAMTPAEHKDSGSCYVAWNYKNSYNEIVKIYFSPPKKPQKLYTLEDLNVAVLESGINAELSRKKLPVAMRFSFGFPISNLGETGKEVRFTIGTEPQALLDTYIEVIAKIGGRLQKLIADAKAESKSFSGSASAAFDSVKTLINIKDLKRYLETPADSGT